MARCSQNPKSWLAGKSDTAKKRPPQYWLPPQKLMNAPSTSAGIRVIHQRRQLAGVWGIGLAGVAWSAKVIVRSRVSVAGLAIRFSRRFTVSPARSISIAGTAGSVIQSRSLSAAKQTPRSGPPTYMYGRNRPATRLRTFDESHTFPSPAGIRPA